MNKVGKETKINIFSGLSLLSDKCMITKTLVCVYYK